MSETHSNLPAVQKSPGTPEASNAPKKSPARRWALRALAGTAIIGMPLTAIEVWQSPIQSIYFNALASGRVNTTKITDPKHFPPAAGPLDVRRGYSQFPAYDSYMTGKGKWVLQSAAPWYDRHVFGMQLNLMDPDKAQAGSTIVDYTGKPVYQARFPRNVYKTFNDIPPALIKSVLFVENAELLDDHPARQNPAVEWDRFAYASFLQIMGAAGIKHEGGPGASTAAVQKEKYKHSPGGMTDSAFDKLQQMLSASARAYRNGPQTADDRRAIALDYINSIPLSSYPTLGDVEGFGDGVMLWFGRDFNEMNRLLTKPESQMNDAEMAEAGQAFREAFYIALSIKKPSDYLLRDRGRAELNDRVNKLLPLLERAGIISPRMRDAALNAKLEFSKREDVRRHLAVPHDKTTMSLRTEMMNAIGVDCGLYCLDRLDARATTTVHKGASDSVTAFLRGLQDPAKAAEAGLLGYPLLNPNGLSDITYSVTLYEVGKDANYLRVQTDTYQGALNLNEGSKLQLGSTAKLRTMVSYLESVAFMHQHFANQSAEQLESHKAHYKDNISAWALDYLIAQKTTEGGNLSLRAMLDSAMERRYSANPGETFFTGGGIHRFNNFKNDENGRNATVRESLQNSHNLPFVRIMRDVVQFTMAHSMNVPDDIFTNPDSAARHQYLNRFIDKEGSVFLYRAWSAQNGKDADAVFNDLVAKRPARSDHQIAVIFRTMNPSASVRQMADAIGKIEYRRAHPGDDSGLNDYLTSRAADARTMKRMQDLYDMYAPGKFSLNDLGYLAKMHPLDLWMAQQNFKGSQRMPWKDAQAAATKRDAAGNSVMRDVYSWLLKPSKMEAQNKRIRIQLEETAFTHLHAQWKKNGFPFDRMTPSLGSALGDSGDTPAALAQFSGILANGGVRKPAIRFTDITLAPGSRERERHYVRAIPPSQRVMPQDVADVALDAMKGVVSNGTARRIGTITLDDGRVLTVGGKTGTGDNRDKTFTRGGGVSSSSVKNRTATFVFEIDDPVSGKRFFGTVLAYVEGPAAANHKFTSSVPTQITKNLMQILRPYLNEACGVNVPANTNTASAIPAGQRRPAPPAFRP